MYYRFSWVKSLWRILAYFLVVTLVGLYLEQLANAFTVGALVLLILHYWQLYRLNRWLWHSKKITPPKSKGAWEYIYDGVYYLQRRNRQKRKELGSLLRRFREGAEALPDAVVVVDAQAQIIWCNRLARIDLGLTWPDDAGRRLDNLIRHPDFIKFFHDGDYTYPIEISSPTNESKKLEYRIMHYGDKHLLLIARDVTQVSQLVQMRKDFVANVSHELRTPLTVLNGYLEMMSSEEKFPEAFVNKAYNEMLAQTSRMQGLVEQLLILSRIEASSERVYENIISVPTLLKTIESEAATLNHDKQHEIIFNVDKNIRAFGVETELRSAFSNLIFNAIHYTPDRGEITVNWFEKDGRAHFSVKDNGDGIAEKHIARLTERFYRVDKARSRKTGGSGLGLSIVKHVLSHHNSHLKITSELGEGSCFSFEFNRELTVIDGVGGHDAESA